MKRRESLISSHRRSFSFPLKCDVPLRVVVECDPSPSVLFVLIKKYS